MSVERAWLGGYCGVASRFLVTRKGVCQVCIRAVLGDSSPVFRTFSTVFPIELFFIIKDFPIATYYVLLNPCMHQILKSVTESFNLEIHSIMSGRGRYRTSAPEAPPDRYVEHTLRSENASINQPPAEPSRAADPGGGTLTMDQVIHIVTAVTHQTREPPEEQRGMIERALKLGAKTYDGIDDPEAAYLWLDRVSEIYAVMGCSDEQKVLFSGFLMAARAKDWWEAIKRRHPTGVTWDQFRQTFTDRFYPRSYQDAKIEELFRLEQRSLTMTEYE